MNKGCGPNGGEIPLGRRGPEVGASENTAMKTGLIGYGYWGPNLLRNLSEIDGLEVAWCADRSPQRLKLVERRYPGVRLTPDAAEVFNDPTVEAVVIATPVGTHYPLAKEALEKGKHVFVEKPMTRTSAEAKELIALAASQNRVLMVDHTFIYTGAVRKIKEMIVAGDLGDLYYFDSVRVNLGLFQHDVDVLWDLAPHDLSILIHLIPEKPKFVSAAATKHTPSGLVDVAYMTVHFENDLMAHFHVNWLSPVKVRQILIGGKRRMVVYNDMEPTEKVKVYDRGVSVTTQEGIYNTLIDYRTGDIWAPKLETTEALAVECRHFLECIKTGRPPMSSGAAGLQIVRLLEAATESLAADGARIAL
jgi:predicted dehydrogenase